MDTCRLIVTRSPMGARVCYRGIRLLDGSDRTAETLNTHYSDIGMLRDLLGEGDIEQLDEFGHTTASLGILAPAFNAASLCELMAHRKGVNRVSIFDVVGDAVSLMREVKGYNRAAANDDMLREDDAAEQAGTWLHLIDGAEVRRRNAEEARGRALAA